MRLVATGAVPAEIAASRRTSEAWMTLWEGLATLAERTPADCAAIGAAWVRDLGPRSDEVKALIMRSAAEPVTTQRQLAVRYMDRMNRLVPRIQAIRAACFGSPSIASALALLEPAVTGAGGHDPTH